MSESTLTLNEFLSAVSKNVQQYDVGTEYKSVGVTESDSDFQSIGLLEAEKLVQHQGNAPKDKQCEFGNEKGLIYTAIDLLNQYDTHKVTNDEPEPTISGCYEGWDLAHQKAQMLRSDTIISNNVDVRWLSEAEQIMNKQMRTQIGNMYELERAEELSEQRKSSNLYQTSMKMDSLEPINPFHLKPDTYLNNASYTLNNTRTTEACGPTQIWNSHPAESINLVDDQKRSNTRYTSSFTLNVGKYHTLAYPKQREMGNGDEDKINTSMPNVLAPNVHKSESEDTQKGFEVNPILTICKENCLRKLLELNLDPESMDKRKLHRTDSTFNVASLPVDSPCKESSKSGLSDIKPTPHGQIGMISQLGQNNAEIISQSLKSRVSQYENKEQAKLIPHAYTSMNSESRQKDYVKLTPQAQYNDMSQPGPRATDELFPVVMANEGSPSLETYFKITKPRGICLSESGKLVHDEKSIFESTFNQEAAKVSKYSHRDIDSSTQVTQRGANPPRIQRSTVSQSGKIYPKDLHAEIDSEAAKGDAKLVHGSLLINGSQSFLRNVPSTPNAQISTASQSFIKTQTIETQVDDMHFESGIEPSEGSNSYSQMIYSDKEPGIKISESWTTSNFPVFDMIPPETKVNTEATPPKQYCEAETQFSDVQCATKSAHDSIIKGFQEKGIQTQTRTSNNNTQTLKNEQLVRGHNKSTSFSSVKYSKYSSTDAAKTVQSSNSFLFNNSEDHTVMDRRFTIPLEVYQNNTLPEPDVVIPQYVNIHNHKPSFLTRRRNGPSPVLFRRGSQTPALPVFRNIPPVESLPKPWPSPEVKQRNFKRVHIREPAVSDADDTPLATPLNSESSNQHPVDPSIQHEASRFDDPSDATENQYVYLPAVVEPVNGEFLGYFLMGVAAMIIIVTVATILSGGLYIGPFSIRLPVLSVAQSACAYHPETGEYTCNVSS